MAILCRDLGLLFIQAPRTGCTAIETVLLGRFGGERVPPESIVDADGRIRVDAKHGTLRRLVRAGLVPADHADRWTSFVAVRNPFDSLVSLYVKQREPYQALLSDPTAWIHRRPRYVESMAFSREHTFEEWLDRLYGADADDASGGRRRSMYGRFVEDVTTIIRFEQLEAGFREVMRRVGVREDVDVPPVNRTTGRARSFRDHYTPRARHIVEVAFRDDLAQFGYAFDDEGQAAQLGGQHG